MRRRRDIVITGTKLKQAKISTTEVSFIEIFITELALPRLPFRIRPSVDYRARELIPVEPMKSSGTPGAGKKNHLPNTHTTGESTT